MVESIVELLGNLSTKDILIVCGFILVILFFKWEEVSGFVLKLTGKTAKVKRSCGDCVLVLLGIREKYEYENRKLDTGLLRSQMTFFEQKCQEIVFYLTQSFNDDLNTLGSDRSEQERIVQGDLYRECLKSAMIEVKDEVRRSFKENGFCDSSEQEFTMFVKNKNNVLLSVARQYLIHHYPGSGMIVGLKYRFEKMDREHSQKMENFAFDIYSYARDMVHEIRKKKRNLKEGFAQEIDEFVTSAPN